MQDDLSVLAEEIAYLASSVTEIGELYAGIEQKLAERLPFDRMSLAVVARDAQSYMHVYTSGEPISGCGVGDLVTRTDSIIWRVLDQQQPVAMNIDSERGGFRSLLAIPIVSSGTLVASLNLRCRARGAYGPEHTALARLFADALAAPLTYLPLCAGLVNKAAHADVIAEIGRVISSSSEISEVYEQFASLVGNVIEFDRLSISSVEPGSDTLRVLHVGGLELAGRSQGGTRSLKGTLVDASIAVGKAVSIDRDTLRSEWPGATDLKSAGLESILAAPLLMEGRPVGALLIARADPTGFSNNDLLLADRISAQIAGVVAAEIRRNELANEQARRHAAGAENLELVGAARAHSEFLTTVSHELLTPVTIISSLTSSLSRRIPDDSSGRSQEILGKVRSATDRLKDVVESLLDISTLESGTAHIDQVQIDLHPALEELVENTRARAATGGSCFAGEISIRPMIVLGNHTRLIQAISNVLDNAFLYSPKDGVISLVARTDEGRLSIEVCNNGSTLSEFDLRRVSEPFYRADNLASRSMPGVGVGLAISKAIVELHDGSLEIYHEGDNEVRVSILLPLASDDQEEPLT